MARFPDSFITELTERNDIVDVVGSYVDLSKRSGSNRFGLCPFHSEKTPSFSVSPSKQIYHCFGCGKGGGVINFIMEVENISFPEAVEFLANRAGMKMPETGEDGAVSRRRARMLDLNRDAARFFFNMTSATNSMDFDLGLAIEQSSQNPVYYVQYAHARICTLIAALAADGHAVPGIEAVNAGLLSADAEKELIKQLAALPEEIRLAARDMDPSRINRYVTELAARFHRFYTVCRIKDAPEDIMDARLVLSDSVRRVIAASLAIIGVSAPEKM